MKTASTASLYAAQSFRELPDPPQNWGADDLTKFWDRARGIQFGVVVQKEMYAKLSAIDGLFSRVSDGWRDAPPDEIGATLLLRSHSAFRAAAGLASAGQVVEFRAVNRAGLEYAAYVVHFSRNPDDRKIWLNRHVDGESRNKLRKALSYDKVRKTVEAVNPGAGRRFDSLYQAMIDFGAHPNERGVFGSTKIVDEPDRSMMLGVMLHGDWVLDRGLVYTARCGMCQLEMLQCVFGPRFELVGVSADMLQVRRGLD